MSIPSHEAQDKTERFDLLVVSDPVWETTQLVDRLPTDRSDRLRAERCVVDGGGSALNSAAALARAGKRVLVVGRVGADREGESCIEALGRQGVTTAVERIPGWRTKTNDLFVERGSGRTSFRAHLPDSAVPPWTCDPPALLDTSGLLLDRFPPPATGWLVRRRERCLRNVATRYDRRMVEGQLAIRSPLLSQIDILQLPERPARGEASSPSVTATSDRTKFHSPTAPPALEPSEVEAILQAGVRILIRTRGSEGVLLHVGQAAPIAISAVHTAVVDPTGAGDAFLAGFLERILSGAPPVVAAEQGVEWAARAVRHLGARGWLDQEPPESR